MALTVGSGPFGRQPAGTFNFTSDAPAHVLYVEDSPRRIRAVVDGVTVADTTGAKLLHETGLMPVYYLPADDLDDRHLEPTDTTTHCPFKGDAAYWTLRVGEVVREDAVWGYDAPLPGAPSLAGYRAIYWDAVDEWYEEVERIHVHARDPYHRCDVVRSDRHVVVRVAGRVVADSHRPVVLFETGLPPRFYLPAEDVDADLLAPSDTVTSCPYKGTTSRYHHLEVGDDRLEDLVWVYDDPLPEVTGIEGLLAFYTEKVDLEVDGQPWEQPVTKFS